MREISSTELEATSGGGFWGDILGAIGNAIDTIIDALEQVISSLQQVF